MIGIELKALGTYDFQYDNWFVVTAVWLQK